MGIGKRGRSVFDNGPPFTFYKMHKAKGSERD